MELAMRNIMVDRGCRVTSKWDIDEQKVLLGI